MEQPVHHPPAEFQAFWDAREEQEAVIGYRPDRGDGKDRKFVEGVVCFLLKMIFTAITISAGFKGGEIVPTFFIGATFGCVCGGLLGLDPGFAAALGLVCLFCGAVNCPVASIFLSIELFGGKGLLFFAVACAFSFALSGYFGLYRSQKILYSKTRAEFININAWQQIE